MFLTLHDSQETHFKEKLYGSTIRVKLQLKSIGEWATLV